MVPSLSRRISTGGADNSTRKDHSEWIHTLCKLESEEQLKAFLDAVKSDLGLQEKLKKAKNADDLAEIAKAAGFTISSNEIQNIESPLEVLSDGELEGVAGGGLDNSNGKIFFFGGGGG